jgi:hypothetical protein
MPELRRLCAQERTCTYSRRTTGATPLRSSCVPGPSYGRIGALGGSQVGTHSYSSTLIISLSFQR